MQTRRWTDAGLATVPPVMVLLHLTQVLTDPAVATIISASALALLLIHRWVIQLTNRLADVNKERRELLRQTAQAQAAEMANATLRDQMRIAAADLERAADDRVAAAELRSEQRVAEAAAALRREYEEIRTTELCESYELGALAERGGSHNSHAQKALADLIFLSDRRPQNADAKGVTTP